MVDEGLMKVFFDCSDILKECRVILLLKKKLYIYIYIYIIGKCMGLGSNLIG